MQLNISYSTLPCRNSVRASQVMDYFGIGPDTAERVIADHLELPIQGGDVVLFTGPSGSGKSSLLNGIKCQFPGAQEMRELGTGHLSLAASTCTLVDSIPLPFEEALQLLSMCGLGEAPLLLRTPRELSEGQRYRFSIALAVAQKPKWIVADEFTAVLDRTTAKVIAYNIRRLADRFGIGFLLATAMDDVASDLQPDLLVRCDLDGSVDVSRASEDGGREFEERAGTPDHSDPWPPHSPSLPLGVAGGLTPPGQSDIQSSTLDPPSKGKKKDSPSRSTASFGSVSPPNPTGRISLGGIIAATRSA